MANDDPEQEIGNASSRSLADDLEELDNDEWLDDIEDSDDDDTDIEADDQDEDNASDPDTAQKPVGSSQTRNSKQPGVTGHGKTKRYSKATWEAIKAEYEAGILSLAAIAAKYGPADSTIHTRAQRYGWKRDLSADVSRARQQALVYETAGINTENPDGSSGGANVPAPEDVVKAAARSQVDVVRSHRKRIARLHGICDALADTLEAILSGKVEGKTIDTKAGPKVVYPFMGAYETISDLWMKLVQGQSKLIPLERQAFGLDKDETPGSGRHDLEARVRRFMQSDEKARERDTTDERKRREASKANLAKHSPTLVRLADAERKAG